MGLSLIEGLIKSLSMTIVSEIGDKTFFIAAILAMKHPPEFVLIGSLSALYLMTFLSTFFGWAAPNFISQTISHHSTTILFFIFGIRSLYDSFFITEESQELKEVEEQLKVGEDDDSTSTKSRRKWIARFLPPIIFESFSLIFLGEWGDKSQIATMGLASQENFMGVVLGGMTGHTLCAVLAVLGGKNIATKISEKMVSLCGGVVFLLFGVSSLISGVPKLA